MSLTKPYGAAPIADTAWVESPLQLLCAVEAHASGNFTTFSRIIPRTGCPALARTLAELERMGLPAGLRVEPAGATPPPPHPDSNVWILGDAFSGQVQRTMLRSSPRAPLLVIGDGLAAGRLLRLLARRIPAPVLRPRARHSPGRAALGLAAALRLRSAAGRGGLTVYTTPTLPEESAERARAAGVRLLHHGFGWLQSLPPAAPPEESLVLLGTSFVAEGLLRAEPYLAWVAEYARTRQVAYYPHYREDERTLEPLCAHPRVRVADDRLPVELSLRGLHAGHRVAGLPSPSVSSLRALLGARGVRIDAVEIPAKWWTPSAAPVLREHLGMLPPRERVG